MFHEVSLQLAEGWGEISRVTVGLNQTHIDLRMWLRVGNRRPWDGRERGALEELKDQCAAMLSGRWGDFPQRLLC